jgi:hypothetical protein
MGNSKNIIYQSVFVLHKRRPFRLKIGTLSQFRYIMNDEVTRLRRLRKTALKVRALASALTSGKRGDDAFERGALLNWRIARIATGRLRSHPYRSYQKDPGFFESGADRFDAFIMGTVANLRGQGARVFLNELRNAARELDDTRALTLSPDLSDALGRAQASMRALIDEVCADDARVESGHESDIRRGATDSMSAPSMSASPYLAL